jgi:hypothetical protein
MIKKIAPLLLVFLVLGCIFQQQKEETKLQVSEGLGILLFGLPSNPSNPVVEVEKVPPESDAFLSLILRNNAEGDTAKNIRVSLDNVEPFMVVECDAPHPPTDPRDSSCYGGIYDDIINVDDYRTHRINEMSPDEELEFFWVLKSPSKGVTGNMYYEHAIYATVNYHYHTSIYTGIAAMTFQEYSSRKSAGSSLVGTSTASAGEIMVVSQTNEPILYAQNSAATFILKILIQNRGSGIPNPDEKVNLTIEYNNMLELNGATSMQEATSSDANWFNSEYGTSKAAAGFLIQQVDPINLLTGSYIINVPFKIKAEATNLNYQILPFYIRISYDYVLESQTSVGVIPS